jgi:hypothetical protein
VAAREPRRSPILDDLNKSGSAQPRLPAQRGRPAHQARELLDATVGAYRLKRHSLLRRGPVDGRHLTLEPNAGVVTETQDEHRRRPGRCNGRSGKAQRGAAARCLVSTCLAYGRRGAGFQSGATVGLLPAAKRSDDMIFQTWTTADRAELADQIVRSRALLAATMDPVPRQMFADRTVYLEGKLAQLDQDAGV